MPAWALAATPAVTPDTSRDPCRRRRARLLAAATEHEQVAALEPYHDPCPASSTSSALSSSCSSLARQLLADVAKLGLWARALGRRAG